MREEVAQKKLEKVQSYDQQELHRESRKTLTSMKKNECLKNTMSELDMDEIRKSCEGQPEDRQHLAAKSPSAAVRQKILMNTSDRSCGSEGLNRSHTWRKFKNGTTKQKRFYRRIDPRSTMNRSPAFSFGKTQRIANLTVKEHQDQGFWEKRPGPGYYLPSTAVETHWFKSDLSPDVITLGANSCIPWKDCLGEHINPTRKTGLSGYRSSMKYSFAKTRRFMTDIEMSPGPNSTKSDKYNLSPGNEYEIYGTFGENTYYPHQKGNFNA